MLKLAVLVGVVCLVHSMPMMGGGGENGEHGGDMGGEMMRMGGDMGGMYGGGGMSMDKEMIEKKMKELVKHVLHGMHEMKEKHEVYRFGLFDRGPPNAFLDPATGHPMGFYPDLIHAMCKLAEKKCIFKWLSPPQVIDFTNNVSPSLNEHYIDAIVGIQSPRNPFMLQYAIANQFAETKSFRMYVKTLSTRTKLDEYNPANDIIGFVHEISNPISCDGLWKAKRNPTDANLVKQYTDKTTLTNNISSANTNTAVWVLEDDKVAEWQLGSSLKAIGEEFKCATSEKGMLVRKEEEHRFDWWYPTALKFMESGGYGWLCNIAPRAYSGGEKSVNCFNPEKAIPMLKMKLMDKHKEDED